MKSHRIVPAVFPAVAILSLAGAARAQTPVPTLHGVEERTAYKAEALRDVNVLLGEWREAWTSADFRALMRTYTRNAVVVLPGDTSRAQGNRAIEQALRGLVPHTGDVRLRQVDGEVGGDLTYLFQRFEIDPPAPDSAGAPLPPPLTGTATMVFQRGDSGWRIRSQVFSIDPPAAARAASAPPAPGGAQPAAESQTAPRP